MITDGKLPSGKEQAFSAADRAALFNKLSLEGIGASGTDLARLRQTFSQGNSPAASVAGNELDVAIAKNAPPAEKVAYIQGMASYVDKAGPETKGIALILASLKDNPTEYSQAVKALNNKQLLPAVMQSAATPAGMLPWADGDARIATAIIQGGAKSDDQQVKASVFALGVSVANSVSGEEQAQVKAALVDLVKIDSSNAIAKSLNAETDPTVKAAFFDACFDALKTGNAETILKGLTDDQICGVASRLVEPDLGKLAWNRKSNYSVYTNIAKTATGRQLAALTDANPILAIPTFISGDHGPGASTFVRAIREHASDQTKLDYIKALAARGSIGEPQLLNYPEFSPFEKQALYNPQADAVGEVISSLKGNYFNEAINSLSREQLNAIMTNSVHYGRTPEFALYSHNIKSTFNIINAAAASNDANVKARVFIAGTEALGYPSGSEMSSSEKGRVAPALTNVMNSDTTGMMTALFKKDRDMDALVAYLQVKIQNKEYSDISNLITRLRQGNDPQKSDIAFLGEKQRDINGDTYFPNQRNLGYFVGSVAAAINSVASSDKERAAIATNIITTLLWAGTSHHPADYQAGAAIGSGLTNEVVRRIAKDIDADASKWKKYFCELSYPRNPKTGDFEPLAGDSQFTAPAALIGGPIH